MGEISFSVNIPPKGKKEEEQGRRVAATALPVSLSGIIGPITYI